ncbi:MAG: hypothetical protein GXP43_00630 [bacterium]|nr:hypothetical protein [bacterium]
MIAKNNEVPIQPPSADNFDRRALTTAIIKLQESLAELFADSTAKVSAEGLLSLAARAGFDQITSQAADRIITTLQQQTDKPKQTDQEIAAYIGIAEIFRIIVKVEKSIKQQLNKDFQFDRDSLSRLLNLGMATSVQALSSRPAKNPKLFRQLQKTISRQAFKEAASLLGINEFSLLSKKYHPLIKTYRWLQDQYDSTGRYPTIEQTQQALGINSLIKKPWLTALLSLLPDLPWSRTTNPGLSLSAGDLVVAREIINNIASALESLSPEEMEILDSYISGQNLTKDQKTRLEKILTKVRKQLNASKYFHDNDASLDQVFNLLHLLNSKNLDADFH